MNLVEINENSDVVCTKAICEQCGETRIDVSDMVEFGVDVDDVMFLQPLIENFDLFMDLHYGIGINNIRQQKMLHGRCLTVFFQVVREIRFRVEQDTGLTCSAGTVSGDVRLLGYCVSCE